MCTTWLGVCSTGMMVGLMAVAASPRTMSRAMVPDRIVQRVSTAVPVQRREPGDLLKHHESGTRGPEAVSSGRGDPGGISYGTYQMSRNSGHAQAFVRRYYPDRFHGLRAGTPEFTRAWREVALADREGMIRNERIYMRETHYEPLVRRVEKDLHISVEGRSDAVRDMIWSVATQHGPNTRLVERAVRQARRVDPERPLSDEAFIRAVYAERSRVRDGRMAYFPGCDSTVQASVARRFRNEEREVLDAMREDLARARPDAPRSGTVPAHAAGPRARKQAVPPALGREQLAAGKMEMRVKPAGGRSIREVIRSMVADPGAAAEAIRDAARNARTAALAGEAVRDIKAGLGDDAGKALCTKACGEAEAPR
jgi:hypothetical protein